MSSTQNGSGFETSVEERNNRIQVLWRRWEGFKMKREMAFGALIVIALLMFELFNFSTTDFALTNLLGDLRFAGLRWAFILAVAFCGMDFAGIARLFTPGAGGPGQRASLLSISAEKRSEPAEVWYLLGAWFLAATMNAVLTWWGVSLALMAHPGLGNEILSREQLLSVVPVFVAVLVWLIRILLIGTFSMSGTRLFTPCRGSSTAQSLEAPPSGRKAPSLTEEIARRTPVRVIGDPPEGMEVPAPTRYPRPQHSPAPAPASPSRPPADPTRPFRPVPKPEPALSEDSNGHRNQFQNLLSSTPALRADVATASRDVATASRDVATASRDVATASRDVATADVATASRSRVASVPRLIRPLRRGAGD